MTDIFIAADRLVLCDRQPSDVDEGVQEQKPEAVAMPTVTLKLRFQPERLFRVYDDYHEELITRNPDGTYDVTVTLPEDDWVYGYVISFGDCVRVLEPPHVRDGIRERLQKAFIITAGRSRI